MQSMALTNISDINLGLLGLIKEDRKLMVCYQDNDGDGFGTGTTASLMCAPCVENNFDLDDNDSIPKDVIDLMEKDDLTAEEIKKVREEYIDQLNNDDKKAELYGELQEKVKNYNQISLTIKAQPLETKLRNKTSFDLKWVMCQFSTIARSLELLGIENPSSSTTYPEYLEITRRTFYPSPQEGDEGWEDTEDLDDEDRKDLWREYRTLENNYRTQHGLWEDLLEEQFEVDITNITTSMPMTKDNFDTHIKSHLDAGEAVITTINGHIVAIQSYDETGVTIDDPYGDLSGKGKINNTGDDVGLADYRYNHGDTYKEAGVRNTTTDDKGDDNVWEWDDIEDVTVPYVKSLQKN